jgi:hypothetical protein
MVVDGERARHRPSLLARIESLFARTQMGAKHEYEQVTQSALRWLCQ